MGRCSGGNVSVGCFGGRVVAVDPIGLGRTGFEEGGSV